ncbi:MAG: hypothetical protein ACRCZ0_09600 [Cetobacterium sp.]
MIDNLKRVMAERLLIDIDTAVSYETKALVEKYESKIYSLKDKLNKATVIRKSECGGFINLSDFCRVQKDFLEINEDNFKQYMLSKGFLTRNENDKYIPSATSTVAIMIDSDLYINNRYARQMLLMRSMIFVGDDNVLNDMFELFQADKNRIIEQIGSTVYVDYRQKSYEFRALSENAHNK